MATQEATRRRGKRIAVWRERRARRQASHSYVAVLLLIVAMFVVIAVTSPERWAAGLVLLLACASLIAALWASGFTGGQRTRLTVLALGAASLAVVELAVGSDAVAGSGWLAVVLLLLATASAIGVGVFDQGEVNMQSVLGAICVYLLLGLLFTAFYGAVASLDDGPLFAQAAGDGDPSLRLYFSYVTLATLGYGDFSPATETGRLLAVAEALVGQLYLVTVVAVLVSRIGHADAGWRASPGSGDARPVARGEGRRD